MANEVINNLLAWQMVKELVRKGSISEAAVALDLDSSKASRLLKSLEDELGKLCKMLDSSQWPLET